MTTMRNRFPVLACAALVALATATALAQRGASGPPEQAKVKPTNNLPNPYETVRNWGTLPNGRKWGSVSAVHVDVDGKHIWAADRCGSNSCAGSDVDPIVKLDPDGKVVQSFGGGQILWPHGMDVDRQGNVWIADARSATPEELKQFPNAAKKGHTVLKFSPQGKLLMTLGTPGEAGDPPAKFTEPNDVLCRYALRPPVAGDRLRVTDDGQVQLQLRHQWADGTTHLVFEPVEFLGRMAVLVPRPAST